MQINGAKSQKRKYLLIFLMLGTAEMLNIHMSYNKKVLS